MIAPQKPSDELERLDALKELKLLDTPREERFDRICRIAVAVFNLPIAVVSLIDANRQWFKSCVGLDLRETNRDISFCAHAILESDTFVINDAHQDERFRDNPLVTGPPHIRFYAGRVIRGPGGKPLGTFCLIDNKPREFTKENIQLHRDLAEVVERELNLSETATLQSQLLVSQQEADRLLRAILPDSVAGRLKAARGSIADHFDDATVLAAIIHDYPEVRRHLEPAAEVELLNRIFCGFDDLATRHGVEKIKSIEAGYLAATGVTEPRVDHLEAMADFALAMQSLIVELDPLGEIGLNLRIGIDTGPVVAGVIGRTKFGYDIWGSTVNAAWELARLGVPGGIQVNEMVSQKLSKTFLSEERGEYYLQSKGAFKLHVIRGRA